MRAAQILYRREPEGWWATSRELPGYSAFGETFDDVRQLVGEGAPWHADEELELHHLVPVSQRVCGVSTRGSVGSLSQAPFPRAAEPFAFTQTGAAAA
jgi:predicted RNase H-like HicB family nuclease